MFEFSMQAHKYFREGYIEIRMRYRFGEDEQWSIITEIVDKERFCENKLFAQRIIDNLLDRSRREVINSLDDLIAKNKI